MKKRNPTILKNYKDCLMLILSMMRIVASFCDGLIYMISFTTELEKKYELLSQIEYYDMMPI